ncbi:unnamed protein product [Orchesella dallaii]|uniref:Doublecortin domain-containing protein n=1 Tax=Orchesella dallaii TaxID=48710 RepID=A0ABP1QR48_9HEXA
MYTSYNREIQQVDPSNTKYTEYLKTLESTTELSESVEAKRADSFTRRGQQQALLPISDNEVKFSNIFSPHESNALKLQLLQKASSLPILDTDNARNGEVVGDDSVDAERLISTNNNGDRRRRSTASGVVHVSNNNAATRKTDSVANILYSTIRHGHEYDNPSADETLHTGSDSKVDYDPHEPLPAVDQIALRHELLNNIRAISRATYFEDLYTGKVRQNVGSPEAEILKVLGRPEGVTRGGAAPTIPSNDASLSRVDRWIKESSEASRALVTHDDKERSLTTKNKNSSLYHQSVWNEQEKSKNAGLHQGKPTARHHNGSETTEGSYTESDVETASAYMRRTKHHHKTKSQPTKSIPTNDPTTNPIKSFSKNTDSNPNIIETADKTEINPGLTPSTYQYLHSKYLNKYDTDLGSLGKRRPFSFGCNSPSDDLIPLSVSLPNVAQSHNPHRSNPVVAPNSYILHSVSRPEHLNYSTSSISTKPPPNRHMKRETINNSNNEQVRQLVQPSREPRGVMRGRAERKAPGIYTRLNMNQWVAKKVWFYINGDDHFPRFEYRFRHGKDIRDLDQLLDILTKRLPSLPTGARYIFTMDGYLINNLEELVNDQSYVVSSIRKFKAKTKKVPDTPAPVQQEYGTCGSCLTNYKSYNLADELVTMLVEAYPIRY